MTAELNDNDVVVDDNDVDVGVQEKDPRRGLQILSSIVPVQYTNGSCPTNQIESCAAS